MSQQWFNPSSESSSSSSNIIEIPVISESLDYWSYTDARTWLTSNTVKKMPMPIKILGEPSMVFPQSTDSAWYGGDIRHTKWADTPIFSTDSNSTLSGGSSGDFYLDEVTMKLATITVGAISNVAYSESAYTCNSSNFTHLTCSIVDRNKTNSYWMVQYASTESTEYNTSTTISYTINKWQPEFGKAYTAYTGRKLIKGTSLTITDIFKTLLCGIVLGENCYKNYADIPEFETWLDNHCGDKFSNIESQCHAGAMMDKQSMYSSFMCYPRPREPYYLGKGFYLRETLYTQTFSSGYLVVRAYSYDKYGCLRTNTNDTTYFAGTSNLNIAFEINKSNYKAFLCCLGVPFYKFLLSFCNLTDNSEIYNVNTLAKFEELFTYTTSAKRKLPIPIYKHGDYNFNPRIYEVSTISPSIGISDFSPSPQCIRYCYLFEDGLTDSLKLSDNPRNPLFTLNYPNKPLMVIELDEYYNIIAIDIATSKIWNRSYLTSQVASSDNYKVITITKKNYQHLCNIYGETFREFLNDFVE